MANILQASFFLGSISCYVTGIWVYWANKRGKVHKAWFILSLSAGTWSLCHYLLTTTTNKTIAWALCYILYAAAISIPPLYQVFIYFLVGIHKKRRKEILFSVLVSLIFLALLPSKEFIKDVIPKYSFNYYDDLGIIGALFFIDFVIISGIACIRLIIALLETSGARKEQLKYVLVASLFGFLGGSSTFFLAFNLHLPVLLFLFPLYPTLIAYAIIKYRLMDIRLAITNVGIFIFVYTLVLGIPFGSALWGRQWLIDIFGRGWFWAPMVLLLILATAGPFTYLFLQNKAEKRILYEEIRIRRLLTKVSYGISIIREVQKLLDLILTILTKTLRLDNAAVYLNQAGDEQYSLKASKSENKNPINININDPLIKKLKQVKSPLILDEIKMMAEGQPENNTWSSIVQKMKELSASVIVPIAGDKVLQGVIVLGGRKDKGIYSSELADVLSVLGNQASLALENCRYMEAETKRMEEEGVKERMVSLDHMASSMAHEIDNPNAIIICQSQFVIDRITQDLRISIPNDLKEEIVNSLMFMKDASQRVADMIAAILEYSRMGSGELKPVKITDALDSYEKLIAPQLAKTKIRIDKDVEDDLPFILGDKVQLEEIFMNLTTNALHAVKYKKGEKKVGLKVYQKNDKTIRIEFSDNGYGIPEKLLKDIFLASVTTKGSVEGTGLGLYRIRQIIDRYKGEIWAESEGKDNGARFIIELPVLSGDINDIINNKDKDDNQKRSNIAF